MQEQTEVNLGSSLGLLTVEGGFFFTRASKADAIVLCILFQEKNIVNKKLQVSLGQWTLSHPCGISLPRSFSIVDILEDKFGY